MKPALAASILWVVSSSVDVVDGSVVVVVERGVEASSPASSAPPQAEMVPSATTTASALATTVRRLSVDLMDIMATKPQSATW
jgi:hypothetical protein